VQLNGYTRKPRFARFGGSRVRTDKHPQIIEELIAGRMRVPNFQRGFVWDPERVAYLMDSIYKGYPCTKEFRTTTCDWSSETFKALKRLIADRVPASRLHDSLKSIDPNLDPTKVLKEEHAMAVSWGPQILKASPSLPEYEARMALFWQTVGCATDPYVLRSYVTRLASNVF
jgi:hypothetical protein